MHLALVTKLETQILWSVTFVSVCILCVEVCLGLVRGAVYWFQFCSLSRKFLFHCILSSRLLLSKYYYRHTHTHAHRPVAVVILAKALSQQNALIMTWQPDPGIVLCVKLILHSFFFLFLTVLCLIEVVRLQLLLSICEFHMFHFCGIGDKSTQLPAAQLWRGTCDQSLSKCKRSQSLSIKTSQSCKTTVAW